MTVCNGCGGCCDPVTLSAPREESLARTDISPRERQWLTFELVPMSFQEAALKEPQLADAHPDHIWFYRCRNFDEVTRHCMAYENRPPTCRGYPWDGGPPKPQAVLPPACSFRADIGQPVELRTKP